MTVVSRWPTHVHRHRLTGRTEPAGFAAEYGRGLRVVDALASTWGWTLLGIRRKAVWAAIHDGPDDAAGRPRGHGIAG